MWHIDIKNNISKISRTLRTPSPAAISVGKIARGEKSVMMMIGDNVKARV